MNRTITISIIFAVIVAAGALAFWLSRGTPQPPSSSPTIPVTDNSNSTVILQQSTQAQQAVQAAYQNVLSKNNVDNIKLHQTVVSGGYALQLWSGDTMGGEALLKFDAVQNRWVIVDPGGGAWSTEGLVAFGVPTSTAEALLSQLSR